MTELTIGGGATDDLTPWIDQVLSELTPAERVSLLEGATFWSLPGIERVGLAPLVMSDGPIGVRGTSFDERHPSAAMPSSSALGASWDVDLARRIGSCLGEQARERGVHVLLAPTINLQRDPRGGRNFENFSEDPLLTARLGTAYILGVQETGVACTAKHFVAGDSETSRFTLDVEVAEEVLREIYLAPFDAAVRAGVWSVMAAYNSVGGTTMTESPMLYQILRDEWGFDGVVISDWFAARTLRAAGPGLTDLAMPNAGVWGAALLAAVQRGEIPATAIDDKVRRILRLAARTGALSRPDGPHRPPPAAPTIDPAVLAHEAAVTGAVLLKNDRFADEPALPLTGELGRIAVIGRPATALRALGGGSATVFPPHVRQPLDHLAQVFPGIAHVPGPAIDAVPGPIPIEQLTGPGGPGTLRVEHLAADATVLHREDRGFPVLEWSGEVTEGVPVAEVATIRLSASFRATETGIHHFCAGGLGHFVIRAGEHRHEETVTTAFDMLGDVALSAVKVPRLTVELAAGEQIDWSIEQTFPPPDDSSGHVAGRQVSATVRLEVDDAAALDAAVAAAAVAEAAVVFVGTGPEVEHEGFDRTTLALPGRQDDLVRAVAAVQPRTIVVVNAGAPVLMPWVEEVAAILIAWFPGQEGGAAIADILTGVAEPGGRLAQTWPGSDRIGTSVTPVDGVLSYAEGHGIGHRDPMTADAAAHRIGAGQGYTSWSLLAADRHDEQGVSIRVANTGRRPGSTVIALWAQPPERPPRVVGFARVWAAADSVSEAVVAIDPLAMRVWDGGWRSVRPQVTATILGQGDRVVVG